MGLAFSNIVKIVQAGRFLAKTIFIRDRRQNQPKAGNGGIITKSRNLMGLQNGNPGE
jgi:hypothetical protein